MALKTELYKHHTIIFSEYGVSTQRYYVWANAYNPTVSPKNLKCTALGRTKEQAMERIKVKIDKL